MDIVKFGASFDFISPVLAVIGNIVNGPSHVFLISIDCGWSGRSIAKLLQKQGIKTWGHMVISDTITISVRKADAPRAQAILDENGIMTETPAPQASKQEAKSKGKEYQPGEGWSLFG